MKPERAGTIITRPSDVRVRARAPRWVMPAVKILLLIVDVTFTIASFVGAYYLREAKPIIAQTPGEFGWSTPFAPYGELLLFVLVLRISTLAYYRLYRLEGEFSLVEDGIRVFKAAAVGSLLIVATAFLYRGVFQFRSFSYSRSVFIFDFLLVLAGFGLTRLFVRRVQTFVRRRDLNLISTLVVGKGPEARFFIGEIRRRPQLGYRVIGVVENSMSGTSRSTSFEGVPIIGDLNRLADAIRDSRAAEVIITDPTVPADTLFDVMMKIGRGGIEFRMAPSLFNFLPRKTEIDQIGALPMITLFRSPLSGGARVVKRASDVLIASAAALVLLPFALIVALLIRLGSRGPVLFTQERVGMDGRIFLFYKFRTMRADADDSEHREFQQRYIAGHPEANFGDRESPVYKHHTDPRITRVGKWLRRTSLDEIPQLLNVLRGDISIVGPRPPIPYEVEAYEPWHRKRLDMKPGLTGLWQVSGRNRLPFEEMVKLDLFYIENWSLLFDLKIVLRTVLVLLRGDGY